MCGCGCSSLAPRAAQGHSAARVHIVCAPNPSWNSMQAKARDKDTLKRKVNALETIMHEIIINFVFDFIHYNFLHQWQQF